VRREDVPVGWSYLPRDAMLGYILFCPPPEKETYLKYDNPLSSET